MLYQNAFSQQFMLLIQPIIHSECVFSYIITTENFYLLFYEKFSITGFTKSTQSNLSKDHTTYFYQKKMMKEKSYYNFQWSFEVCVLVICKFKWYKTKNIDDLAGSFYICQS